MSVLIDTGVFYAHHDPDAERHESAVALFDDILNGVHGQPLTSDYVVDETVTLTRARTGSVEAAATVADRILGVGSYPPIVELVMTGRDELQRALEVFREYGDHELSLTDAMTIVILRYHDIDAVASFDAEFDGLVDRIEAAI